MKISPGKTLGVALFFIADIFGSPFCGTRQIREHFQSPKKTGAIARTANFSTTNCDAEAYYDTSAVKERKTSHFRIYYVLEGPHKTTEEWVDSLALALEASREFHIRKHGAKIPRGANPTWHFQKTGDSGLYPVEVLDISLVRGNAELLGGVCEACMGITFPPEIGTPDATEIVIDNDFLYPDGNGAFVRMRENPECLYAESSIPVTNGLTGKNYAESFGLALQTTAAHEFYHAIQATYIDFLNYDSYWFEASATALEELASPDANDYWLNVPSFFNSTETPFDKIDSDYGIAVWGLYNFNVWGENFDTKLWERFSAMPDSAFGTVYAKELETRGIDPDSAFDDFARKLFFSGTRSNMADSSLRFAADFSDWPASPLLRNASLAEATLGAPAIRYQRITRDSLPDLSGFVGKASIALYGKNRKPEFFSLDTISWTGILPFIAKSENAVLILSRLRENAKTEFPADSLPMRAYPNPWRGETPLCFAGLPQTGEFLEIRTRAGKLVRRFSYSGTTFCIRAEEIQKKLAPGLYYFRPGAKNRAKPFLVVY